MCTKRRHLPNFKTASTTGQRQILFTAVTALLLSFSVVQAQPVYYLLYDKNFNEHTGAEDLVTIHKALYLGEEKILTPRLFEENNALRKVGGLSYRLAKSFVLDYPVAYFIAQAQHEVFGHGARFTEAGYTDLFYKVSLPVPLGDGLGYTMAWGSNGAVSIDNRIAIDFAGAEANQVLAQTMRTKWLMSDTIHYRDFFLYARSFHNLSIYIYKTLLKNHAPNGDMDGYLDRMNAKYPEVKLQSTGGGDYSINDLGHHAIVNFADPFQYLALYQWARYIITGKATDRIPMIRLGGARYLPSANLGLTPFGAEFYVHNYIQYNKKVFNLYYRHGDGHFDQYYGFGLNTFNLVQGKYFYLHANGDVWDQPAFTVQRSQNILARTNPGVGGSISTTVGFHFTQTHYPASIVLQGGYKSDGYLQGENLAEGFFLRVGLGITGL